MAVREKYVWRECALPGCGVMTQVSIAALIKNQELGKYCGHAHHADARRLEQALPVYRKCQFPGCDGDIKSTKHCRKFCGPVCARNNAAIASLRALAERSARSGAFDILVEKCKAPDCDNEVRSFRGQQFTKKGRRRFCCRRCSALHARRFNQNCGGLNSEQLERPTEHAALPATATASGD
jgi:hypothetical protein